MYTSIKAYSLIRKIVPSATAKMKLIGMYSAELYFACARQVKGNVQCGRTSPRSQVKRCACFCVANEKCTPCAYCQSTKNTSIQLQIVPGGFARQAVMLGFLCCFENGKKNKANV